MLGMFGGSSDAAASSEQDSGGKFPSVKKISKEKTKEVECYENQRYQVGVGFNADGLLPTDRLNFSTMDGLMNFKSLDDANVGLVTPGWNWVPTSPWLVDTTHAHGNPRDDGWMYGVDFANDSANYSNEKNAFLHFVRRRRFTRRQIYSQDDYQQWLADTTRKDADAKEENERQQLLSAAGGAPPPNAVYGAFEEFGRTLYTLPSTVVEGADH